MATRVNFGNAEKALQSLSDMAAAIDSIGPADVRKALEFGTQEAEQLAQDFAVKNFNKSGVKSRTGELKRAVGNSRLQLIGGGRGASLLNFGLDPGKDKDFYIRANAVNYGAIRSPEGNKGELKEIHAISGGMTTQLHRKIGKRRRTKLKAALQGEIKKGSRAQKIARGLTLDTESVKISKAGSVSAQTSLGAVTVTKAFDYFKLSSSQTRQIVNEVVGEAIFYLENLIGRKAR
jgi:hypothetical protein